MNAALNTIDVNITELEMQRLDLQYNWHPCTQMKDFESCKPLVIKKAYGSTIELQNGQKIIDAISSWWCKSLGHNHPSLKAALLSQLQKFEHVIFANTTNETIVKLSEKLANLAPNLKKVFYAGDGSSAIEIAMKMSLHSRSIQGDERRQKFIAFNNAYHGETLGALSVSDLGSYRTPYGPLLFDPILIAPLYVNSTDDPGWNDATFHWNTIEAMLQPYINSVTAIVFEPIVQGAAGMKIISRDFLKRMQSFAKAHHIHLIADEIMTGIARTGTMLASGHANLTPDFICLSKGLTSGWLPFSAVLTTDSIYEIFYGDYGTGKDFLHSHTFSGNVMGACLAFQTLLVIEQENLCDRAKILSSIMREHMMEIAFKTQILKNVRSFGALVAADVVIENKNTPFANAKCAKAICQRAIELGALLRPLGNTIYWIPPLIISDQTLRDLRDITMQAILDTIANCVA